MSERGKMFRRAGNVTLPVLALLLVVCIVFGWIVQDSMFHLSFVAEPPGTHTPKEKALVDVTPWQTAQALRALAATPEERDYAREAERLADREVDQAFASTLREATMKLQRQKLSGQAMELSKRVDELQQLVNQDTAQLNRLTAEVGGTAEKTPTARGKRAAAPQADSTDVDIAKAQLQLDTDQLADAVQGLARASGDNRAQIESEHAAREAAMQKYASEWDTGGRDASAAAGHIGTLASRLAAWSRLRTRSQLLEQAIQQSQAGARDLTREREALAGQANANGGTPAADGTPASGGTPSAGGADRAAMLASIRDRSAVRQLLSIYGDRIQAFQDLAGVYSKWLDQVGLQRRVVRRLILRSSAVILLVVICMIMGARLVRGKMTRPLLDRRQNQTARMILELAVQFAGVGAILLVFFGVPSETPTILGLATAALTIALQDYIISFLGWFRLVGKHGIRVGDWVEINSVAGQVVEIGLMTTTLLETGGYGYRTGRSVTFMNSFAIRGLYFNFSTNGNWMWDELSVPLPAAADTQAAMKQVLDLVREETGQSARLAEQEWKHGAQRYEVGEVRVDPAVNLRPSGSGADLEIRYVTRAWEREETRNRLYGRIYDFLNQHSGEAQVAAGS